MREQFNDYIEWLRKVFDKNPSKVNNELYGVLKRLEENPDSTAKSIFKEIDPFIIFIGINIFLILLIGLFNISTYYMYFFGLIFFIAGYLIGKFVPMFGIIFLFSHGGTGFGLMIASLIGESINNPLFQDNPINFIIYFVILLLITAVATLLLIINNLSKTAKELWQFKYLPLGLYTLVLFCCGIFPHIMQFIYRL